MQPTHDSLKADILAELRSDLALAARSIRQRLGFTAVVALTLALGIGMNTSAFSIVRGLLITPLSYRDPGRLYRLYAVPRDPNDNGETLSTAELTELATESKALADVTLFGNYAISTYTDGKTAESWQTAAVAPNFFEFLGVRPTLGRAFTAQDVVRGAPPVVVIMYAVWERAYGRAPAVLGRQIQLDGRTFTIVGVLPKDFVAPTFSADAIRPVNVAGYLRSEQLSRMRLWRGIARLRDGVSAGAFESELPILRSRVQARYPNIKSAGVARAVPLQTAMVGPAGPVVWLVMGGALVVLLVTCVNIAGLMLSRGIARRRELGVRIALGANRGRLMRQLLAESALQGLMGATAGVGLAFVMKRVFAGAVGSVLPRLADIPIDWGVLTFAAIISIASVLAFALLPAFVATRLDPRDALSDGARGGSQGAGKTKGTSALVAAQMAFALVLTVAAGLLLRTFVSLVRTDAGYPASTSALTFHVDLPPSRYADTVSRSAFLDRLTDRLGGLQGVHSAGYTAVGPWNGTWRQVGFRIEGVAADPTALPRLDFGAVSDAYFRALGMPLKAGRAFGPNDRLDSPRVIIISESVARRFWPNSSPLGARVRLDTEKADSAEVREVVGVVGDVRPTVMAEIAPTVYIPDRQLAGFGGEFVVRTAARDDVMELLPAIKQAVRDEDPLLPVRAARRVRDVFREAIARQELAMAIMGGFAALAVLLAAIGVYSITAYAVLGRTREFAIRAALGARPENILVLVMRQGLMTTTIGVVIGLAMAALTVRFMSTLIVRVSPHDALTFTVAPAALVLLATAACLFPALPATRAQPTDAMRAE